MRLERLRTNFIRSINVLDEESTNAHIQGNMEVVSSILKRNELLLIDEKGQRDNAKMLLQIGNGKVEDFHQSDPINYSTTYKFRYEHCFILDDKDEHESKQQFEIRKRKKKEEALQFFYPGGFQSYKMSKKTILAATNKQVDDWNTLIQQMNPNFINEPESHASRTSKTSNNGPVKCRTYSSADKLNAVDDPNDIISQMLTDEMLNKFENDKAPPHQLTLCVGDICYLLRTLGRQTK